MRAARQHSRRLLVRGIREFATLTAEGETSNPTEKMREVKYRSVGLRRGGGAV